MMNYLSLVCQDRDRHCGGMVIFIHESIPYSIHLAYPTIELLLVNLKMKHSRVSCGLYYLPPSANQANLTSPESALEELHAANLSEVPSPAT